LDGVIAQTHPDAGVAARARITLHLFGQHGLMDDTRIGEAFRIHGLAD